jgi:ubiquinol-cytochrome c reductase iron-sulfur subunit
MGGQNGECCGGGCHGDMTQKQSGAATPPAHEQGTRRDFIYLAGAGMGAVATAAVAWPLINSMNPAADTLALATVEIDISKVEVGQAITVMWRGKPVFIRHRTEQEITTAKEIDGRVAELRDKQLDADRAPKSQWMIVEGVCTHLGCVPQGQKSTEMRGEFGGWFCPCHGSSYDTSGRIMSGPAPLNLPVPPYTFVSDTVVRIG